MHRDPADTNQVWYQNMASGNYWLFSFSHTISFQNAPYIILPVHTGTITDVQLSTLGIANGSTSGVTIMSNNPHHAVGLRVISIGR